MTLIGGGTLVSTSPVVLGPAESLIGWEVDFTAYGLPQKFRPVHGNSKSNQVPDAGSVTLVYFNEDALNRYSCRDMLRINKAAGPAPGNGIKQVLELLFGFR